MWSHQDTHSTDGWGQCRHDRREIRTTTGVTTRVDVKINSNLSTAMRISRIWDLVVTFFNVFIYPEYISNNNVCHYVLGIISAIVCGDNSPIDTTDKARDREGGEQLSTRKIYSVYSLEP